MQHLRAALGKRQLLTGTLTISRRGLFLQVASEQRARATANVRALVGATLVHPSRPEGVSSRPLSHSVRLCQTAPSTKQTTATTGTEASTKKTDGAAATPPDVARVLEELRSDAIVYRRVQLEKLKQILARPLEIPRDAFEFLLRCCGNLLCSETIETRMRLCEQFWFYLGPEPQPQHWKALLQVYRENEHSITDVPALLESMGTIEKDAELYRALFATLAEQGDLPEMKLVRDMMLKLEMPLTVEVLNVMIRGNGRAGDLDGVQMVLETMSAGNVSANGETYGELMIAFLRDGMTDRVLKLVREKGSQLKEDHVLELLELAVDKAKQPELVRALLKLLPGEMIEDGRIHPVLRNTLSALIRHGRYEGMLLLLGELPVPQFRANENTDGYGTFLMVEMLRHGAPFEQLDKLLAMLIRTERNLRAYHVACECAAKANHRYFERLLTALAPLEALRPHYFWPLFLQRFKSDSEAGVLGVLKLMQKLAVEPDQETIVTYVLPKLSLTLKDARAGLKILEDRGVRMALLMTPYISHLLYQNRFTEVLDIVRRYPTKLDTEQLLWPLILQANINRTPSHQRTLCEVLRALVDRAADPKHDLGGQLLLEVIASKKSKHDGASLRSLLREYEKYELRISRMAAGVLKNHFARTNGPGGNRSATGRATAEESAEGLLRKLTDDQLTIHSKELFETITVHPRDMNYDELECHLVELEQKKLNTRGVLRRLLLLCVRENRLDRALELKRRCDAAKVDQSSGMLAALVELYTKCGKPEQAGRTLEQLRRQFPGFTIDEHKVIDYAALLVSRGQLDGARKVLHERATTGGKVRTAEGATAGKNIWQLLTNTAQYAAASSAKGAAVSAEAESPNTTRQMLDFLVELGYCTYDNALLGPVVREYLLAGQHRQAIEEFKRIAIEKRRTPLQLEILTLLVGLTNGAGDAAATISADEAKTLLSEILQTVTQIHGPVNTNNTLIVALADAGTEAQLRRMLINPEVRINHSYILTQCEFLMASGKVDVVLRLAKCSKGLANVREQDFLQLVLGHYVRENNCEAAVQLFQRLVNDEDELKVTTDFARKLSDLLEANNYEVPDGLKLYLK
ncbi:leucine-rich PPR motif-containing protein, mitochondrial-like [Anopheles albimanus]|uniref:Pentacotripeptide-repeat region of PRORP domain-containing protein n=1 Tax=Anopheles albimanus TaxID=7167 RepID=A0A182FQQ8_ANOAL|nr:leucine-rich PPR motif-containing protein, mitochondrial-like [Anopheles albimanus]